MVAAAMMMFYAAQHSVMQQKTASNQYQNVQAFEAAEGGLEFGVVYLNQNSSTITASPSNGYINYGSSDTNITNISLGNGSKYSVVYTNPTQNNYQVIQITSTGTSNDGTSTRIIRQQVAQTAATQYTVTNKGDLDVNGHGGMVTGTFAVHTGGNADSSAPASGGQIIQNDLTLHDMSGAQIFQNTFGVTPATFKSQSTSYANESSVPWGNSLSGKVWINGDVSISGQTTAGTVANPVALVITGNYTAAGQATINGVVYVMGDTDLKGNANIIGALIGEGNVILRGNGGVTFNASIINQLIGSTTILGAYAKIPGSWRDF